MRLGRIIVMMMYVEYIKDDECSDRSRQGFLLFAQDGHAGHAHDLITRFISRFREMSKDDTNLRLDLNHLMRGGL